MGAANRAGRRRRGLLVILIAPVLVLLLASVAHGAERIYWGNYDDPAFALSYANVDGSGGADLPTPGVPKDGPQGFSLNPATGTLYWANYGEQPYGAGEGAGTSLAFAQLDGSGGGLIPTEPGTVQGPHGTAIDQAAGRIFWTNQGDDTIRYANLNGSGGGVLNTANATVSGPRGLALDLAGGRIYWANHNTPYSISYANLNGNGGGNINTAGATLDQPEGVAIFNGRIYWGGLGPTSKISFANLDGSGGGDLPGGPATVSLPHGVAIDPISQTIYWVNYDPTAGTLSYEKLDGSDGADISTPGATMIGPAMPMLLRQPSVAKKPVVHGTPKPGSKLTCTPATWGANVIAAQFYQSPQSVAGHWLENGKLVKNETGNTLKVHDLAEYSCLDSAVNAAGTASKASDPIGVFKIGALHRNLGNGTAKLRVKLPGPGFVKLLGRGIATKRLGADPSTSRALERKVKGHRVKLKIKPKGNAKRRLDLTGKVKIKVRVSYRPADGVKGTQRKVLRLKEG